MRLVCLWRWLGKGFHALHRVAREVVPQTRTQGPARGEQPGSGRATAEAWALLRGLPLGPLGPASGPVPKKMGFPWRVTGGTPASRWLCPLPGTALSQPVSSTGSWDPNPSEGGSSERGLWARGFVGRAGADSV